MKRGEIWLVNLDPTIGAEIKKVRPAIIINHDSLGTLPLRIVVPITTWKDHFSSAPWMIRLVPDHQNKLDKVSSIDCFQIRSISVKRLVRKIGVIDNQVLHEIDKALKVVLKMS